MIGWLEFLLWFMLLLAAGAGSAAQTIGASARELQPSVFVAQATRARRLNSWGGMSSGVAMAVAAALAVLAIQRADGDAWLAALGAALSVLIGLSVQATARRIAHSQREHWAPRLLGEAAAFLPLVEPSPEAPETAEARDETVEQMVDVSEKVGLIESDEHQMITGILQLDRTLVREIMVPRIDVIALDVETSLRDALDVMIAGAHSRVPVYEESVDHVIGLLYAKEVLKTLRERDAAISLRALLRPAYFVPESKRLDELLQELQKNKVHMAIVVDEYGGTAGIVTIEDILEEIVGEIQDEYDTGEEPLIERLSENEGVFNARVNIDEVNEALSLNLPNESDTLGGLVYQRLEKMPKVGDQVRVDDVTIAVLSVVGRRIKKVRVARIAEEGANET